MRGRAARPGVRRTRIRSMERCLNGRRRYFVATSPGGYVAQSSPSDIVISSNGNRRYVPAPEPNQLAMSPDGVVVRIDGNNKAWYIPADGTEKQYGPSSDAIPTALGVDGHLGAWGDIDGVAHVRDTRTGATWTFVGHSGPIGWIFVSERLRKVVTVGWSEVRVWRIPALTIKSVVRDSCNSFMMASSPDAAGSPLHVGMARCPCSSGVPAPAWLCVRCIGTTVWRSE